MSIGKILDSTSSFLIQPQDHGKSKSSKALAWTTTIIVGVATVGIAQGASVLWKKLRPVSKELEHPTRKKIEKIRDSSEYPLSKIKISHTRYEKFDK